MADRGVEYESNLRKRLGITDLAERFVAMRGDRVSGGPLSGLRYTTTGDAPVAKLLGTYEAEIHPWIDSFIASGPRRLIVCGTADGYYAVGLKRLLPDAEVHGFEISPTATRACRELASLNGVELTMHGRATAQAIAELVTESSAIVSDIEGHEADIFTPALVAVLRDSTVIVEAHEVLRPGVVDLLRQRFSPTHIVEEREPTDREPARVDAFTEDERRLAVSEMRVPGIRWMRFSPIPR
jgi:hypothetical protein